VKRLDLRPRARRRPVLNVTSLIDVLFLLLIFLMVSSTFVEHPAIELDLPKASTSEPVKADSMRLTIPEDGRLILEGEEVQPAALTERLREAARANPELLLILEADRSADYGRVVEALDAAREAGVKRISAFTRRPEAPESGPPL
jgi:biopolymer transport protein ExbD